MKYIKLYEKFDSDEITKVLGFLSKKTNIKSSSRYFLNDIKRISNKYDIPESMFNNVKYMKANDAYRISNFEVNNQFGIYAIVFWFSVEGGYITYSDVKTYNTIDKLEKLKSLGYKKGKFIPIKYSDLEDGDKVAMYLSSEPTNIDRFTVGEIYVEQYYEEVELFFLQNSREGGYNTSNWRDRGYRYSWGLGNYGDEAGVHCEIYKYIESDEPISIEEYKDSMKIGQLPHYYTGDSSDIKKADFALVMYLDDVIIDLYDSGKTKKEIKSDRIDSKKDALALLTDDEIREANIDRYIDHIYKKYNITKEEGDLSNLNSLVKILIHGDIVGFYMFSNQSSTYNLNEFSAYLYRHIHERYDKSSDLKYIYDRTYKEMVGFKRGIQNSKNKIKESQVIEIIELMEKLGKIIIDKCNSTEIKNAYDLRHFYQYFYTIHNMVSDSFSGFGVSYAFSDLITDIMRGKVSNELLSYNYSNDIKNVKRLIERLQKPI